MMVWWVPLAAAAISAYAQQQAAQTKAKSQESIAETQAKMEAEKREQERQKQMAELMVLQQNNQQRIPPGQEQFYG